MSTNPAFTPDESFLFPYPFPYEGRLIEHLECKAAMKLLTGATDKKRTLFFSWCLISSIVNPEHLALLASVSPVQEIPICSDGFSPKFSLQLKFTQLAETLTEHATQLRECVSNAEYIDEDADWDSVDTCFTPYLDAYARHLDSQESLDTSVDVTSWKQTKDKDEGSLTFLVKLTTQTKPFKAGAVVTLIHYVGAQPTKSSYYFRRLSEELSSGATTVNNRSKYEVLAPKLDIPDISSISISNYKEISDKARHLPFCVAAPIFATLHKFANSLSNEDAVKLFYSVYDTCPKPDSKNTQYILRQPDGTPYLCTSTSTDSSYSGSGSRFEVLAIVPSFEKENIKYVSDPKTFDAWFKAISPLVPSEIVKRDYVCLFTRSHYNRPTVISTHELKTLFASSPNSFYQVK